MRVKIICRSPAGDFCDREEPLSDCGVVHPMGGHMALQSEQGEGRAQPKKANLGFAAPATRSWSTGPQNCSDLVLPGARTGINPAREPRGSPAALCPSGVQRTQPLHRASWAHLVTAQNCRPSSGKTPTDISERLPELAFCSWT